MQKLLLFILLTIVVQAAQAQLYSNEDKSKSTTISFQPKIGYSISNTSFNISGNDLGKNPNVLSELIWNPTNAIEYGADITLRHQKFVVKADVLLNSTLMGNVSDIDYDGDNRTLPYSKLYLSNHKGNGYALKLQPGYDWSNNDDISFVTFLSLDYSGRTLYLLNDKDWRSNDRNYISGLNSYYKYKFPSYGLGAQLDYKIHPKLDTHLGAEAYISTYNAYGNWNLIDNFEKPISYIHKGNGSHFAANTGISYVLNDKISLGFRYHINHFSVANGKDYLYTIDEGMKSTRLNKANETKHSFLLNLKFDIPLAN